MKALAGPLSYLPTAPGWAVVGLGVVRAVLLCTFTPNDEFSLFHYAALAIDLGIAFAGLCLVCVGRWVRGRVTAPPAGGRGPEPPSPASP